MQLYNNTILLPNLQSLFNLLSNNENENNCESENLYNCKPLFSERIAIQHFIKNEKEKERHIIRIWNTTSLFDYWYYPFDNCGKNFIATIDYFIRDEHIKINHLGINDFFNGDMYNNSLDNYDSEDLVKNLINFVKMVAKEECKDKIILDVHENLRLFFKYYYYIGFKTTNRKCTDNPFWIQTELII
jgi:hypothetical protein